MITWHTQKTAAATTAEAWQTMLYKTRLTVYTSAHYPTTWFRCAWSFLLCDMVICCAVANGYYILALPWQSQTFFLTTYSTKHKYVYNFFAFNVSLKGLNILFQFHWRTPAHWFPKRIYSTVILFYLHLTCTKWNIHTRNSNMKTAKCL